MNVYFIQAGRNGPIKIGVANDIKERMATLQTGNHLELFLLVSFPCKSRGHAEKLEKQIHRRFKADRLRGEWFNSNIRIYSLREMESENMDDHSREEDLELVYEASKYI